MARPTKRGIDYFPLDVDYLRDKKFKLIKGEFGAIGVLIIIEILCRIYDENGYYKKFDDDDWIFVSEEVGSGCNANLVKEVVERSVMRGLFDETVRNQFQVLTSAGIQKRFLKAAENRQDIAFIKDFILIDLAEVSQSVRSKIRFNEYKTEINYSKKEINYSKTENNPQRKREKKKIKEREGKEASPSLSLENLKSILPNIEIDCDALFDKEVYQQVKKALDESQFATLNFKTLSILNKKKDKLINGEYKDFIKPKEKGRNEYAQHKYTKEELREIFGDDY